MNKSCTSSNSPKRQRRKTLTQNTNQYIDQTWFTRSWKRRNKYMMDETKVKLTFVVYIQLKWGVEVKQYLILKEMKKIQKLTNRERICFNRETSISKRWELSKIKIVIWRWLYNQTKVKHVARSLRQLLIHNWLCKLQIQMFCHVLLIFI
jgi:ADP-heptose:LPS heptosyltransferase